MHIQITNIKIPKNNQIIATKATIGVMMKRAGWKIPECVFKEIRPELIKTTYRGSDGKNAPASMKQYKSRAELCGTLNMK